MATPAKPGTTVRRGIVQFYDVKTDKNGNQYSTIKLNDGFRAAIWDKQILAKFDPINRGTEVVLTCTENNGFFNVIEITLAEIPF